MFLYNIFVFILWTTIVLAAPAPTKSPPLPSEADEENIELTEEEATALNTGLYYDQYLQEVIKLLESNADFKKKMESADFDDIRNGKLSDEVNFMPHEIREKLNEMKREEVRRLRKIVQAKGNLDKGKKVKKSQYLAQVANHLDHDNPHTFEASDLTNLIRAATSDLENFDKDRHEEFKKYEMKKELQREEKMRMLNEVEREKAREEYIKRQKDLAENNGMHHPGSKAQLEEVWNEEDGLNEQEFNPKTFFSLHDLNGDGYLDGIELEALFDKDLGNAYNQSDPEFDYMQMEEERRRMREHVMKEVDTDNDSLISLKEFLIYTNTDQFANPDESTYQTIDQLLLEHSLYTKDELEKYRTSITEQEAEIKQKLEVLKAEAQNLGGMRKELSEEKKIAEQDGHIEPNEKVMIEVREQEIKDQEEKLQEIHKDLQQQSREVMEMKQEVKKHEVGEKITDQIKQRIDEAPEGPEKEKAIAQAHEELQNLKKVQGVVDEQINDLKQEQGGNSNDQPPPPPEGAPPQL